MKTIVTFVSATPGGIDADIENRVGQAIKDLGVESLVFDKLSPGRAMDIVLPVFQPNLAAQLRQVFQGLTGLDVFVQKESENRKKKLLLADMDATMIEGEVLEAMADHMGLRQEIAEITQQAMLGKIDFAEGLVQRVALLKGLPESALQEVLAETKFSKGAETLIKTMNRHGAKCILVSGGFEIFTRHVAQHLGFYKDFSNRLEIQNGMITGQVIPPVFDQDGKKRILEEEARALQLDLSQTAAVGDGANDIPMLQAAGAGFGHFAKPAVIKATPHHIRYSDLSAILYMQGYREQELVA